jgi:hypothetical protein
MAIDLEKRAEKVGIILEKRRINGIACQVKLGIDRSGSMDDLYHKGTVQDVVERILAISLNVDMDQTVDVWAFHNNSYPVKTVTVPLDENYVTNEIVKKISSGSTSYAPCMKDILASSAPSGGFLGFGKKAADPTLAIFITDGENDDQASAEKILKDSQKSNIYWLLVGIGTSGDFSFIRRMGDQYPNVGFVFIGDVSAIDDDDMYSLLLNEELAAWFGKFKK